MLAGLPGRAARLAGLALAMTLAASSVAAPAIADPGGGGGDCGSADCNVWNGRPGAPGDGGGGGGGDQFCESYDYVAWDPQPPPDDALWDGHPPGGAFYFAYCVVGGVRVREDPALTGWYPPAGPTPEELARRALATITLRGAAIGVAPDPAGAGLTGLPVWLWTAVNAQTWGPNTASSSSGGLSVTITARAVQIVWDMGEGHQVVCANPGTAYQSAYGNQPSPTCGYIYAQPSRTQPSGRYTITATTTWRVDWDAGGGRTGVIVTTRAAQTTIRIDELQVVTG